MCFKRVVCLSMHSFISQEFWSPNNPLQSTIISLIEQIVVAMGEELKVYLPPMVQPVLRVFMQDQSERKIVTQKVKPYDTLCLLYSMAVLYIRNDGSFAHSHKNQPHDIFMVPWQGISQKASSVQLKLLPISCYEIRIFCTS